MSESVIADFVGKFHAPNTPPGTPVAGRIVCSQRRLVLAANSDDKLQIPLSAVVDLGVGTVPANLTEFFDSTVTIAFEREGRQQLAAVEADNENIRKFATVLFSAILNGTDVTVAHPARRGGWATDEPFVGARVRLEHDAVQFAETDRPIRIGLKHVTSFDRGHREIRGRDRPVLVVGSVADGEALTTLVAMNSTRKLSLLGRFFRIEYAEHAGDAGDLDLSDRTHRALVVRYAAAGERAITLERVLDVDQAAASRIRTDLAERGLLENATRGTRLTYLGRIVVENSFDTIE
jgi:helix-turn-helix protein